jgi:hypothetical protein
MVQPDLLEDVKQIEEIESELAVDELDDVVIDELILVQADGGRDILYLFADPLQDHLRAFEAVWIEQHIEEVDKVVLD